jgi:hypothetical protein
VPSDDEGPGANKPAFAGFRLKSTGHADTIKTGGDVTKAVPAVATSSNTAATAYTSVKLKKAAAAKPPSSAGSSDPPEKPSIYANTRLKVSTPVQKPKVIETRPAPYVGVQLKSTGQAENLKKGKDIVKNQLVSSKPPPYRGTYRSCDETEEVLG